MLTAALKHILTFASVFSLSHANESEQSIICIHALLLPFFVSTHANIFHIPRIHPQRHTRPSRAQLTSATKKAPRAPSTWSDGNGQFNVNTHLFYCEPRLRRGIK